MLIFLYIFFLGGKLKKKKKEKKDVPESSLKELSH